MDIRTTAAALLILAACDAETAGNERAGNASAGAEVPPPAPAPAPPEAPAEPIRLSEKSAEVDFSYVIPREAAAVPPLRDHLLRDAEKAKAEAIAGFREYAAELPEGANRNPYGLEVDWKPVAETAQLIVLVSEGYIYLGGAHGGDLFETILWDKQRSRAIEFAELFTGEAGALATIRQPFCDALRAERAKRLGVNMPADYECPGFEGVTLAPTHIVGGKFGRIGAWVPAGLPGAYAEGGYDFEFFIPKAMIGFVVPEWRPSFPG